MRPAIIIPALVALAATTAMPHAASSSPELPAWLAGCWSADGREAGSGEHWMQPAGGTMLGMSRTVRNGATVAFEYMQIKTDAAGRLVFIATPSGQKETTFTLTSSGPAQLTFENPQHDFPQLVSYEIRPEGGLRARIQGKRGEAVRTVDFNFSRVPCPGS